MRNYTNKRHHLLLILIFLLFTVYLNAQHDSVKALIKNSNLKEELVLQTDRQIYLPGENVWFRTDYLVNGIKPSPQLSNIIYVELFLENKEIILQKKYKINERIAHGMIKLPVNIPSGNYVLRVYTQYQRNHGTKAFAQRHLIVVNPGIPPENRVVVSNQDIQIVPGNGVLLSGTKNKVVLMLGGLLANKADKIEVLNQKKEVLHQVDFTRAGLGHTFLEPSDSSAYTLRITGKEIDTITKPFPTVKKEGIKTSVERNHGLVSYKVLKNKKMSGSRHLILRSKTNETIQKWTLQPSNKELFIEFSESKLQRGINYLLLTNNQGEVIKVNALFNSAVKTQTIDITPSKKNTGKRENFDIKLESKDICNVSLAIVPHNPYNYHQNHLPEILIRNPHLIENYMYNNLFAYEKVKEEIDLAMVLFDEHLDSTGWENFQPDISDKPVYYPEFRDLTVSGVIRDKNTKQPLKGMKIYNTVLFDNPQFHIYETKENGEFIFSLNDLQGMQDIYICPVIEQGKGEVFELLLNQAFEPEKNEFNSCPFPLDYESKEFVEELMINRQVTDSNAKKTDIIAGDNTLSRYFGEKSNTIQLKDYIKLNTMEEVFVEIIPHVDVRKEQKNYMLQIHTENEYYSILPGKPLVLVDNVPIFNHNKIMDLHPEEIEEITTIYSNIMLGEHTINGVVIISTKENDFGGIEFPENSTFAEFQTLAEKFTYIQKLYTGEKEKNSAKPDFRTVLLWKPTIKLGEGVKTIPVSSSDREGKYDIIARGYREDGTYIFGKETIVVKEK